MGKRGIPHRAQVLIVCLLVILLMIILISFVSAGFFSDVWNKMTGKSITGNVVYDPVNTTVINIGDV